MSSAALAVTLTPTMPKRSVYGRTSKGSSAKALFGSYLACACR